MTDRAMFLNNAITLFKWTVVQTGEGKVVSAIDKARDVYIPYAAPFVKVARKKGEQRRAAR